jgi:hypothetical protein
VLARSDTVAEKPEAGRPDPDSYKSGGAAASPVRCVAADRLSDVPEAAAVLERGIAQSQQQQGAARRERRDQELDRA